MGACCCHGLGEPCGYGDESRHAHQCLPRYLDLGDHCPDDGCAGKCWTSPTNDSPRERAGETNEEGLA